MSTLIRNKRCRVGHGEAFGTFGDLNRAFRPKVVPLHLRSINPPAPLTDYSTHPGCSHLNAELNTTGSGEEEKRESGSFYTRTVLPQRPGSRKLCPAKHFLFPGRAFEDLYVCVCMCPKACVCVCVLVSLSSPRALTSITAG